MANKRKQKQKKKKVVPRRRLPPSPRPDSLAERAKPRTILTEEFIQEFCELVRRGVPATTACDYLGISYMAYHDWLDKGLKWQRGNFTPPEHAIFGLFAKEYQRAAGRYGVRTVDRLNHDDNKDWYKSIVILERRDRKNWAKDEPTGGGDEQYAPDERFT